MKRFSLPATICLLSLLVIFTNGCLKVEPAAKATKEPSVPDLFHVMFSSVPNIYDNGVWDLAEEIGAIVSRKPAVGTGEKISISIKKEFMDRITSNTVFYTAAGRLQLAKVDAYGEPLPPDAAILGFSSKMAYRLFKVKTALTRSGPAAARRAQMLLGQSK